jgi:hypothetical protein
MLGLVSEFFEASATRLMVVKLTPRLDVVGVAL